MSTEDNKDPNVVSSSSSSSIGHAKVVPLSMPIYSQPRLMPAYRDARNALDLSIGIKG
jgi:hypothetical protein